MTPTAIFNIQLGLGYVPWLLCFGAYGWPRLLAMSPVDAHRAIATLHSFRFFGLVFLLPGVVGPGLPAGFAAPAAWGDFATGVLAMLALMSVRIRPVFWGLVASFNVVGMLDLLIDYYHGVTLGLPEVSGQLAATYVIPIVYVPILMITHVAGFVLLARTTSRTAQFAT
ncbi:MAG TPA: hypothetical protein VGH86_12630 [Phenylobacterium sp.]|jgi:hypothetical protein